MSSQGTTHISPSGQTKPSGAEPPSGTPMKVRWQTAVTKAMEATGQGVEGHGVPQKCHGRSGAPPLQRAASKGFQGGVRAPLFPANCQNPNGPARPLKTARSRFFGKADTPRPQRGQRGNSWLAQCASKQCQILRFPLRLAKLPHTFAGPMMRPLNTIFHERSC